MFEEMQGQYRQIGRIASRNEFNDSKEGKVVRMVRFEAMGMAKNFMVDDPRVWNSLPPDGTPVRLICEVELKSRDGDFNLVRPRFEVLTSEQTSGKKPAAVAG